MDDAPDGNYAPQQILMGRLLHDAVLEHDISTVAGLLASGAQGDVVLREGCSALHLAVGLENVAVSQHLTRLLLEAGADPNIRGSDGVTPVHIASMYGRCSNLELLLLAGGDPFLEDSDGVDAFSGAQTSQCALCLMHLEKSRLDLLTSPTEDSASKVYYKRHRMSGNSRFFLTDGLDSPSSAVDVAVTPPLHLRAPSSRCAAGPDLHFHGYNPRIHQIDVTSPDHPVMVKRQTVNPSLPRSDEQHTSHDADHSTECDCDGDTSDSSISFHTCSDGRQSKVSDEDPDMGRSETPLALDETFVQETVNNGLLEGSDTTESDSSRSEENESSCESDISQSTDPSVAQLYFSRNELKANSPILIRPRGCQPDCHVRADELSTDISRMTLESTLSKSDLSSLMTLDESSARDSPDMFNRYAIRTAKTQASPVDSGLGMATSDWFASLPRQKACHQKPPLDGSMVSTASKDSQCSCQSATSIITHLYTDTEEGYSLMERQFFPPAACDFAHSNTLSHSRDESMDTTILEDWRDSASRDSETGSEASLLIPSCIRQLSDRALREELASCGENPGPVVGTTRTTYERYLVNKRANRALSPDGSNSNRLSEGFLPELREALNDTLDSTLVRQLDASMSGPFQDPDTSRRWREGCKKCSFNYLLLDPRVTCNLPGRIKQLGETEGFKCFLKAIFYIGKGKRSRPYCHFKEAMKQLQNPQLQPSSKVSQILDIWASDGGVISLHIFQNVIPVEAYTREACMIQSLGLNRLTNVKGGDFYGPAATWCTKKRRQLGAAMLKRAFRILLLEGERQIRPHDMTPGQ